jgi:hypothetical protein
MTAQQYIDKLSELHTKHNAEIKELQKEYVLSNAKYKIGDIIENYQKRKRSM